jgi:hypothetical protein
LVELSELREENESLKKQVKSLLDEISTLKGIKKTTPVQNNVQTPKQHGNLKNSTRSFNIQTISLIYYQNSGTEPGRK